ncbi:hypothetical protein KKE13_02725 [Patescibacteria group bacterium]|nr:hypothetical protein [Patescibacteria group bacterium]
MSIFAISGLLLGITIFPLGLFVLFKNTKSRVHQTLALFCFAGALWGFGSYKSVSISLEQIDTAFFWWRITHIGIILMPVFLWHFVYSFLYIRRKAIIVGVYLIGFFFLYLNLFTDLFLYNLRWIFNSFYWNSPATFYYSIFVAFFFGTVIYIHYELFKAYKKTVGLKHTQIKYLFLAALTGFAGGGTSFLPVFKIDLYPFLNFTTPLYPALIAYAILKYRLMDIRLVVKRSSIFSLIVIAITAVYAMSAYLVSWLIFGGIYTFKTQIITGLIVALLVAVAFRPLYEWLKKITDTFLFKGEYLPQELLADISDVVSRTLDLNVVIDTLKDKISQALRVKKIDIIILEENMGASISKGDFLMTSKKRKSLKKIIDYFEKSKEVLVLEELKRKYAENIDLDKDLSLIDEIEKFKVALIIPLLVKRKLVGLFLLKEKRSGDMFTNEDIKTLETIAGQAGIAIENARLYEEMRDFSKTLQKEVNSQTKELKDANIRLQQLDKAKSEFISLASHQLRTPLTIIKGYISMILEGTWGQVIGKQREQLDKIYSSNERLIKLVEDLLTVSRIESGRLEFDWELVSLEEMVESVIREFSQVTAKKELYLKFIQPKKALSKIKIDSLKIRQVVQNLVDNALHYTKRGGAIIRLKQEQNKIIFSIKDTGIGISSKEQVILFEKFSRGREVGKMHTEGVGLGLYLGAKMIEAHHGRIWVESEGGDKGSTFFFSLPIKRKKK